MNIITLYQNDINMNFLNIKISNILSNTLMLIEMKDF